MRRNNTPWGPTPAASVSWTDTGEPFSTRFDDVYYTRENGMSESRHVFLQGNRLVERWQEFQGDSFCVAETGFGTGLNFLLTWQAWRQEAAAPPRLHFISVEKFPLAAQDLARALNNWPELTELAGELLAAWPGRLPGQHRLQFDQGRVTLDLWWEEAAPALANLACHGALVDAWYLDGFAPSRNESMWQQQLFTSMGALSRPGATLATFTAAGQVRRGLESAGFRMHKVAGFGRKRESLAGVFDTALAPPQITETPWDLPSVAREKAESALIVGAGLAGATLANALANRGVRVTVLEKSGIAGEASGNEQGILYTRLSRRHSSLTDFALQSFRYSSSFYRQLFARGKLLAGRDGELCGSFHQQTDSEELSLLRERLQQLPDLASVLSPEQVAVHLGVQPALPGYWFPGSGWLHPPAVCRALLDSPGINVREDCGQLTLQRNEAGWQAVDTSGRAIAEANTTIICSGTSSNTFTAVEWLPLQSIRGQTTYLSGEVLPEGLDAALCHKGYVSPARRGRYCIGASFKLRDASRELREQEHRENIDKLLAALPQLQQALCRVDTTCLEGRVGFRCASPDYLPIAGPVPDRNGFLQAYAPLRKNARQTISLRGEYVPGLYINTAHGSRGLTSAPLCAQVLAADICGEAPPLSRELLRALSPARFLIRDLARNKI